MGQGSAGRCVCVGGYMLELPGKQGACPGAEDTSAARVLCATGRRAGRRAALTGACAYTRGVDIGG